MKVEPYYYNGAYLTPEDFVGDALAEKLNIRQERAEVLMQINAHVEGQYCPSETCKHHKEQLPKLEGMYAMGAVGIGDQLVEVLNQFQPESQEEFVFALHRVGVLFMEAGLENMKARGEAGGMPSLGSLMHKFFEQQTSKSPEDAVNELLQDLKVDRNQKSATVLDDGWRFDATQLRPWLSYGISKERFLEISHGIACIYAEHTAKDTDAQKIVGICYEQVPVNGPGEQEYRSFGIGNMFLKHHHYKEMQQSLLGSPE